MALLDVIKYDGENDRDWLIYKYPKSDLVLGSQLIVNQSQLALFYKSGEVADVFSAGTYTLKTGNLPLLNRLVNLPFGKQSPFSAEVYFVNLAARLDMNWGTARPMAMEDPRYGIIVHVRIFGKFGVRIEDARQFVTQMAGAMPDGETNTFLAIAKTLNSYIHPYVTKNITEYIAREKKSFLELGMYLEDISAYVREKIREFFTKYGLKLLEFTVESITVPDEEIATLQKQKEKVALGIDFYRMERSFDVAEKFAQNEGAGTFAGMSAGLGAGFTFGEAMGKAMEPAFGGSTAPNQAPTAAEDVKFCSECGARNPKQAKFCSTCGSRFPQGKVCPGCGRPVREDEKFCSECGYQLR